MKIRRKVHSGDDYVTIGVNSKGEPTIDGVSASEYYAGKTKKLLPRKPMATPLQTKEQRAKMRGLAFTYARALLLDTDKLKEMNVGRSPFAHIDAETIAQRAWADGYTAALRDVRKGVIDT